MCREVRAPGLLPQYLLHIWHSLKEREEGRENRRRGKGKKGETEVKVEDITCPNHPEGSYPAGQLFQSPDTQHRAPRQTAFPALLAKGGSC